MGKWFIITTIIWMAIAAYVCLSITGCAQSALRTCSNACMRGSLEQYIDNDITCVCQEEQ